MVAMRGDFGEVRSLLNAEDGASVWSRLCEVLDTFDPSELDAMVFPYIEGHVRRWDDAVCVAPQDWVIRTLAGEELPFWSIVRKIDLSYQYLDAEDVLRLLASPRLSAVTILDLDSNRIGREGAEVIAEAESLSQIKEIRLSHNRLTVVGLASLIAAQNMRELRVLDLEANSLGATKQVPSLADAPWSRTLTKLNLSRNRLGHRAFNVLFSSFDAPGLEHLILDHNPTTERAIELLCHCHEYGGLPSLGALELRDCSLDTDALARLFSSSLMQGVERIDLSHNESVDDGAIELMLDGAKLSLKHLSLRRTKVTRRLIERLIAEVPTLATLSCPAEGLVERQERYYQRFDVYTADAICELREMAPHIKITAS